MMRMEPQLRSLEDDCVGGGASPLSVSGVSVAFGGVQALRDVTLQSRPNSIVGIIGPNGAGKTTLFNVCSGVIKPTKGAVHLLGRAVTHMSASGRAALGLGRTFQRSELFDSMTVEANVRLGCELQMTGEHPLRYLRASRSQRSLMDDRVGRALDECHLNSVRADLAGTLPTGLRRRVELARLLAGSFPVLLLDEISSGLDQAETLALGDILIEALAERELSVLLVEHDMSLVSRLCTYLYVLDFGELIFEGETQEALASEVVKTAYLGVAGG